MLEVFIALCITLMYMGWRGYKTIKKEEQEEMRERMKKYTIEDFLLEEGLRQIKNNINNYDKK